MIAKSQTITLTEDFIIPKTTVIPNLSADNSPIGYEVKRFVKGVILQYNPQSSWHTKRYRVFKVDEKRGITTEWVCSPRVFEYVWNTFRTEDLDKL